MKTFGIRPGRAAAGLAALSTVMVIGSVVILTRASGQAGPPASPPTPARASCTAQALPTLGGGYGAVQAAARNGAVVGSASDARGASHAVIWRSGKAEALAPELDNGVALAVNARGDVLGIGQDTAGAVGWVRSQGRTWRLKADPGEVPVPAAMNDSGLVVGSLSEHEGTEGSTPSASEDDRAAYWRSPSAQPVELPPLPGDKGADAFAVDNKGRIGGLSSGASFRPVIWDASGRVHELPGLGGGYGAVRVLGDSGTAAGDVIAKDGTSHAVVWDANGRITDLGLPAGASSAQTRALLPDGTVLGLAKMPTGGGGARTEAVRWSPGGSPQLLPAPSGSAGSLATGATGPTTYVGYASDPKGGRHPMTWLCGR